MSQLTLTFWGGIGTVTGANFLLENGETRILVDCGLVQGVPDEDALNRQKFPYDPKTIDFLFVTHAHMDHLGRVPKLVKDGFKGIIYSTPETKELASVMFEDAMKVMQTDKTEKGVEFLYSREDLDRTMSLWRTISYHDSKRIDDFPAKISVTQQIGNFSVLVKDAGHILGSAMYEFSYSSANSERKIKKILFTGDSGNSPSPLLRDTDLISDLDYLVMDSVYGDRNHGSKDERDEKFKQIVLETIAKGGTLVIPAFSLERTQVILYELNNMVEGSPSQSFGGAKKKIPSIPVYLDSPLAEKVTEIYRRSAENFNDGVRKEIKKGDDIFSFPKLFITHGRKDSEDIEYNLNSKIIIAGSGMSNGGRVVGHEIHYLPDPKATILLMGYQAPGTLGRQIENFTPTSLKLRGTSKTIEINGQMIPVKARIEMISGYSSHKDSDHLVEMVAGTAETLKKVFVTMGEPKASTYLAQRLREELEVDAVYPERGVVYEL